MRSDPSTLLLRNAAIGTDGPDRGGADSLLVGDGLIRWIGRADDAPVADRVIDVGGSRVVPGLTDAHAHLYTRALELLHVRLADAASIADLLARLQRACAAGSPGEWIVSSDYSELVLAEHRHPLRAEIDAVSAGRPVLLRRTGGHLAVANSAALQAAGFDDTSVDPVGGTLGRVGGRLSGVLAESAADIAAALAPPPSRDRTAAAIRAVARECLSLGIVSVVEAAVGFSSGFDAEWAVWNVLRDAGDFPLRMGFMLRLDPDDARQRGLRPSAVDPRWQIRTLKFFVDGIIGARTAALSAPYADTDTSGLFMEAPEALRAKVIAAHADGWQLAAHVIGDRAIAHWLDCLAAAQAVAPRPDPRHRLEHFALPGPQAVQQVKALGAVVVPQHGFLHRLGASFAAAVGPERAQHLYPGRTLLAAGVRFAGSSDLPIGPLSPFVGMAAAVSRTTANGMVLAAHEALTRTEALASYAEGGPFVMEQEASRGRLAVGQLADLAVLDRDVMTCAPDDTAAARSRLTVIGGAVAFSDGTMAS
ncbi:amidohydrolase [Bradyrhizobium sp. U87765 SZCCT0131]|uniref:amidohydrolase n=1 Tax=unclassified Bradyrhizobium TaxID=2631580 RepID=UPI001BAB2CAF|nr:MULTISPECIES: amidohydrolase [unclassified Bradyrhizobium]MBR1217531.1 amidohydrolase [Bradyrhizobium sp. U87765 SZCCT0131]MBR1264871.1 amidohydrolase [Bradyrhizobium sp. U87765 SZCCT0134]MBR1304853.1 amidohydrolase [Bradyrhizobium sp. U87765 SZCCT0110]MBR1320640.1 amidohydrolase [Bradyrhizobium sp. U87765 SZCCT0109]MBR1349060.1 amidohydrolase [Bradyrhizobium sp. U87765 SZCCT0048]